jgi:hypothetical protein
VQGSREWYARNGSVNEGGQQGVSGRFTSAGRQLALGAEKTRIQGGLRYKRCAPPGCLWGTRRLSSPPRSPRASRVPTRHKVTTPALPTIDCEIPCRYAPRGGSFRTGMGGNLPRNAHTSRHHRELPGPCRKCIGRTTGFAWP